MSEGYILQMKNITKTFPGVKALSDVTLEVAEASIHAICGENGAGKSTLMKVLSGVYPYGSYDGEIFFQGKKMIFKNIKDSERAGIVIIHQELTMIPELSVTENIFMGNEIVEKGLINWGKNEREQGNCWKRWDYILIQIQSSKTWASDSSSLLKSQKHCRKM